MRRRDTADDLWLLALLPLALAALGAWMSPWLLPMHVALDLHQMALAWAGVMAAFLAGRGHGAFALAAVALVATWLVVWPTGIFGFALPALWRYLLMIGVLALLLMRELGADGAGASQRYRSMRIRMTFWSVLLLALIMSRLLLWGYY